MLMVGKEIMIRRTDASVVRAMILGLARDGGLRIKKENTEETIYSGSIIPL